jgi:1-acyl-sn-glycerol-3-phosphate acyltransferase
MSLRAYLAIATGALALRTGLHRPPVDSVEFFRFRREWNRRARAAFGVQARCDGPLPVPSADGRGTLIVANHAGFADVNMLVCETPPEARLNFVAKAEMGRVPIFGWHLRHYGDVLVERGSPSSRRAALQRALERLGAGFAIGLFPEGRRSADGRPQAEISPSLIELAIAAGVAVVPAALAGTRGVYEELRVRPRRVPVFLRFGPARRDYVDAAAVWRDVVRMWNEIEPEQRAAAAALS